MRKKSNELEHKTRSDIDVTNLFDTSIDSVCWNQNKFSVFFFLCYALVEYYSIQLMLMCEADTKFEKKNRVPKNFACYSIAKTFIILYLLILTISIGIQFSFFYLFSFVVRFFLFIRCALHWFVLYSHISKVCLFVTKHSV